MGAALSSDPLVLLIDAGHAAEVCRALSGLASGPALAVRPAGSAEAPALKGGSLRSFLRSG